jgi:hypothetical protein
MRSGRNWTLRVVTALTPVAFLLMGSGCSDAPQPSVPSPAQATAPNAETKPGASVKKRAPTGKVAEEDTSHHLRRKKAKGE